MNIEMNPLAVEQAKLRLKKAESAANRLDQAKNYAEAEDAWTDFLLACSAIYSKLEQGAKLSNGASQAWYGRMKKIRKDDPLLSYLHHARNSDEHGVERIAERRGQSWDFSQNPQISGPDNFGKTHRVTVHQLNQETNEPTGITTAGILHGPTLWLISVTDSRFGDTFDPPRSHLGQKIDFPIPQLITKLAVTYLEGLIGEAEALL